MNKIIKTLLYSALALFLVACGGADVANDEAPNNLVNDTQDQQEATNDVNVAPTISGTPSTTAIQGANYSFTPVADDENNDTLTFTISNKPVWAIFNVQTGNLSGTPTGTGTFSNIRITVSDGQFATTLTSFDITVQSLTDDTEDLNPTPSNQAPVISGTPGIEGREDQAYSFTPTASDPEEDALTFSITNKPAWLDFNTLTGALTGTPSTDDVGSYSNIQISVSDGTNNADLDSFNIEVKSTSATISWTAPSVRADNSPLPLSELSGFRIYSGTSSDNLTLLIDIDDSSQTEYKVSNLNIGTHYYAVSAYNIHGDEGVKSDVVSKTIN